MGINGAIQYEEAVLKYLHTKYIIEKKTSPPPHGPTICGMDVPCCSVLPTEPAKEAMFLVQTAQRLLKVSKEPGVHKASEKQVFVTITSPWSQCHL